MWLAKTFASCIFVAVAEDLADLRSTEQASAATWVTDAMAVSLETSAVRFSFSLRMRWSSPAVALCVMSRWTNRLLTESSFAW